MQVDWDYTDLSDAYLRRPGYADAAIDDILSASEVKAGDSVCDIGAGTGTLTVALAKRGLNITAIEPNLAMATHGLRLTAEFGVHWIEAVAEATTLPDGSFPLVTFGSSFNVTQRDHALREAARILQPDGWIACLFNHRVLDDPLQRAVQDVISREVPSFSHGSRREDQSPVIATSRLFEPAISFERSVVHRLTWNDYLEAWRSHCTLKRQSGDRFPQVISAISAAFEYSSETMIEVPYQTRVWMAKRL